jgi:hypothetical protein
MNGTLVYRNLLLMLLVTFMPFPTVLLREYSMTSIPLWGYGASLVASNLIGFIWVVHLHRSRSQNLRRKTPGQQIPIYFYEYFLGCGDDHRVRPPGCELCDLYCSIDRRDPLHLEEKLDCQQVNQPRSQARAPSPSTAANSRISLNTHWQQFKRQPLTNFLRGISAYSSAFRYSHLSPR